MRQRVVYRSRSPNEAMGMSDRDKTKAQLIDELAELEIQGTDEKWLRTLLSQAIQGLLIIQDFRIISTNAVFAEISGYSIYELQSLTPDQVRAMIHPEDQSFVWGRFQDRLEGKNIPVRYEYRGIRKDGSVCWLEIVATRIEYRGKPAIYGALVDITERKRAEHEQKKLEAQLQHVQRMESIGTLAGGIAHNFNNILMGISGNTSLLLLETDPTHSNYPRIRDIEKMVDSASKLTRQLLGYARGGTYEVRPMNLNQVIKETANTFGVAKRDITIHQELAEGLCMVRADQGQIEQALLNLFVNAADAMPRGGELFIKSTNVTEKDMSGTAYSVKPGTYALITVRDTGVGMDKKTVERIFEPFFTTKGFSKGTGLGLASTYGIIKAHGGYLDVDSKKGQGATFYVYLPASEKKLEEPVERREHIVKGSETILLIEDEAMLLELGSQLLGELGYTVLAANGGKEAVEIYKEHGDSIDLVILDMIMPDMGGGETFDRLKEINPGVRVLLSSGYSIDGRAQEIMARGCDGFIQKPFSVEELSQKIREIVKEKHS